MDKFQTELNAAVNAFVAHISELARRAAVETLESAFAGSAGKLPAGAASALGAAQSVPGRPRGTRGAKRTSEDIEASAAKALAFIKAHPGLRIEQINKELGTSTKDLALPMRKLIAEKRVVTKGQKRSTTYFPGRKA